MRVFLNTFVFRGTLIASLNLPERYFSEFQNSEVGIGTCHSVLT